MKTMTLEQVLHSQRTALHDDPSRRIEFFTQNNCLPGQVIVGTAVYVEYESGGGWTSVEGVVKTQPQDGWHHPPGCDCEFCAP